MKAVSAFLYHQGQIEVIDESLYAVSITYAEAVFNMIAAPEFFERTLIDERFSPDNFYNELRESEATTIEEAEELYNKLERGLIGLDARLTEDN